MKKPYCSICGGRHNGNCDPRIIARIDRGRKAYEKRLERLEDGDYEQQEPTLHKRLRDGFAFMNMSEE